MHQIIVLLVIMVTTFIRQPVSVYHAPQLSDAKNVQQERFVKFVEWVTSLTFQIYVRYVKPDAAPVIPTVTVLPVALVFTGQELTVLLARQTYKDVHYALLWRYAHNA